MVASSGTVPRENQVERLYEELRELVVDGRLAPGSRVMAADLARRLDVSRRTIHVALHRLEQDGLLERLDGSYARWLVPPLTQDGFRDTMEVIGVLEGFAGRLTAGLEHDARAALVAELRAINTRFRTAGEKESLDGHVAGDCDNQFHTLTTSLAGAQMRATLDAYRPRLERYVRSYMGYLVMDVSVSAAEHEEIIAAIERADADEVERTIRANRFQAAARYAEVIERMGERGKW
jgi:DNA-binding GntR family transcriptional regulator